MNIFNIIGPKFEERDRDLFFDNDELMPLLESDKTMAHLLVRLGKFKSVGEAKRNGWDKPVPFGWTEISIGKNQNKVHLFIWNPETTLAEWIAIHGDE